MPKRSKLPARATHALDVIKQRILIVRGFKVLLDSDLATLYGVETRRLNEQVRRNLERFPKDFLVELTPKDIANLKSQIATSSWGGRRTKPLAFTEHGAIMAASILNAPRAIEMSVFVVRAFVALREVATSHRKLKQQLDVLERHVADTFAEHDQAITDIVRTLRQLMTSPDPKKRPIGFVHT
jgi:hypothetical protein